MRKPLILVLFAVAAGAQPPLSLGDAVKLALRQHPAIAASQSGLAAAQAGINAAPVHRAELRPGSVKPPELPQQLPVASERGSGGL